MTIIVIEGPDGAGKTTLTEMLRSEVKRKYFAMVRHSCRPYTYGDAFNFYQWLLSVPSSMNVIVDRHPLISEPIYGPILRGKDLTESISLDRKLEMIDNTCNMVVYCRPPIETIRRCLEAQPQLAGVYEHIEDIVLKYDQTMDQIRDNLDMMVVRYDWTAPGDYSFDDLRRLIFGAGS